MKIIEEFLGLVFSTLDELKTAFAIMKLESNLAAQSIFPLLISVSLALLLFLSLWFSALTLIGYGAFLVMKDIFYSLGIVFTLNLIFLLCLFKFIQFNLRCMSFEKTRHYLSKKVNPDDELKKTTTRQARVTRKKITSPTT